MAGFACLILFQPPEARPAAEEPFGKRAALIVPERDDGDRPGRAAGGVQPLDRVQAGHDA
jgi:hypothetical protein